MKRTLLKLPNIAGDSNSGRGEEKQCPPEQAPASQKRRAGRKWNTQKPEVTNPPKLPQLETE
ncbi:hypothetical protein ACTXT7_000765 [Hymenolepis weldensis]